MIQEGRVPQAQRDEYTMQARAAENTNIVEVYQLHDMKTSITFSQSDHPPVVPRLGHAPPILDAQIRGYDMDRVFMDGGSSLNIIFTSTLHKMLIPQSVWKKSGTTIYGIVPGEADTSLGTIELDVIFGSKRNFARQVLESKCSTGSRSTTPYLDDQCSHNSWRFRTMRLSNSRCQDPQESSQSTEASPSRTSVTAISTKSPTRLEPNK